VKANGAELHEVLANLVHNAIKYTPRGGNITVTVRREASHALAEVCDSGPGIAPERRDSVFERFHRDPSAERRHPGRGPRPHHRAQLCAAQRRRDRTGRRRHARTRQRRRPPRDPEAAAGGRSS
jgi:hypothetical protein